MLKAQVCVIDFGSQYSQLLVRKTRELGFSCEITSPSSFSLDKSAHKAVILSGGPDSVLKISREEKDLYFNILDELKEEKIPTLGVCFGFQLLSLYYGGVVEKGIFGEYGQTRVFKEKSEVAYTWPESFDVWMSHFDHVVKIPKGTKSILKTAGGVIAALKFDDANILALQFHPEVHHTAHGSEILLSFYEEVAQIKKDWSISNLQETILNDLPDLEGKKVLCAFSGGIDSFVAAALLSKKLSKDDLYCIYINNGLMRPQDERHIEELKRESNLNIEIIDASDRFLNGLEGVFDPEKKRKIIGKLFIDCFEERSNEIEKEKNINFHYLLQGTLYPDVIESHSPHSSGGKSSTIKSHHNVGGLPEKMKLKLLEPLRFLFKDEVRLLGENLGLHHHWIYRHPFPGPGLAVRILGSINREDLEIARLADEVLFSELKNHNLYQMTWQALAVLLPIHSVGVKGDERVYEKVICIRAVSSVDGMTADATDFPSSFLKAVSSRMTAEIKGIVRVVYDLSSKPPATIEWE